MPTDTQQPVATEEMENITPPAPPVPGPDDLQPASQADYGLLASRLPKAKSIAAAALAYNGACSGGDAYPNNCAHFLADAFVRAGYTELDAAHGHSCIESGARCATAAKRAIRARNMWCWFQSMDPSGGIPLPKNQGMFAVFQLDETAYWGGHVLIIDTDTGKYYGTGNYPDWKQHCYKW